jgi:hypothetical protein
MRMAAARSANGGAGCGGGGSTSMSSLARWGGNSAPGSGKS